jgi:hypothetical protein
MRMMASKREMLRQMGAYITGKGGKLTRRQWGFVTDEDLGFRKGKLIGAYPGIGFYRLQSLALKEYSIQPKAPVKPAAEEKELSPLEKLRKKTNG